MSTPTEDRLVDLFAAVDSQVRAPGIPRSEQEVWARSTPVAPQSGGRAVAPDSPRRRSVRRRRPVGTAAAAAAVLLVVVVGAVTLWSAGRSDTSVVSSSVTVSASEFDRRAGEVCAALARDRAEIRPRFETVEAYVVSAQSRAAAVDRARQSVRAIGEPADAPELPSDVVRALDSARSAAESVVTSSGVEQAAERWASVDSAIDRSVELLAAHGADGCAP